MVSKVIETIEMPDKTLKDFIWYSDDLNSIGSYWEDRGLPNVTKKVIIDGVEVSLDKADEVITKWERELLNDQQEE